MVREESLRGACGGCSGKAAGGLKKARGAGIWPSTGTGSAFLPKIPASGKEIERDSHVATVPERRGRKRKLRPRTHLKEGSNCC
jgi:hypothetical protein